MSEDELFSRRPMGMQMAMIVRQWRAVIDDAILDTGLTQSSWTVMVQLQQLGDNVSVSELAEVQGIELPPLMRTSHCWRRGATCCAPYRPMTNASGC
jgi:hypothetical protein